MKDVLAIITPAYANGFGEAANYAFVLAGLFEAHVTVLITEIEPAAPAPMSAPDLMQAGGEVAGPRSTNEDVAHAIELVQGAARRVNVACTVLSQPRSAELREVLIDTAQVRDIVTIDVRGPLRHPRRSLVGRCAIREWSPDHPRAAERSYAGSGKSPRRLGRHAVGGSGLARCFADIDPRAGSGRRDSGG